MQINFDSIYTQDGFEVCGGVISRGIARLYYEQGFPLAASARFAAENDLKISWLNVARQFQQQGFSNEKILSEFRELLRFRPEEISLEEIESFCKLDDEAQKERLWQFWGDKLITE